MKTSEERLSLLARLLLPAAIVALLFAPTLIHAQTGLSNQWIAFSRAGSGSSNGQCFTPNNVGVSGGFLVLTAQIQTASCSSFDESLESLNYTAGYVSMRTFNFLYGTIEFRARFGPCAGGACGNSGYWPAVWMNDADCEPSDPTGTDNNCNEQEIDITEFLSSNFMSVNQQIHTPNFGNHNDGCTASVSDASLNWHVYDLVWSAGSLVWKIDGATTCTITQSYVPNAAMYVKMDQYVGGCCGGSVSNSTFPWLEQIDYVKVTQGSNVVFNDDFGAAAPSAPSDLRVIP
jgi:beta-glucanase (GH16 family)